MPVMNWACLWKVKRRYAGCNTMPTRSGKGGIIRIGSSSNSHAAGQPGKNARHKVPQPSQCDYLVAGQCESRWSRCQAEIFAACRHWIPRGLSLFTTNAGATTTTPTAPPTSASTTILDSGNPDAWDNEGRPILFGEYCHLNAYNRREQIGDPGLRDAWGLGLSKMWELMGSAQGCLGGSIWAAMDDTFFLPDGRTDGYGTWGPLDGWRRPKPEYWHVTKAYSPVRIVDESLATPVNGEPLHLTVENRSDFVDLNEFTFNWTLAGKTGVEKSAGAPGAKGKLAIPVTGDVAGKSLEIRITGPRGFMVDAFIASLSAAKKIEMPLSPVEGTDATGIKTGCANDHYHRQRFPLHAGCCHWPIAYRPCRRP